MDDARVVGVVATSCATGSGIDELERALFELCPVAPLEPPVRRDDPRVSRVHAAPATRAALPDLRTDRGYRVVGTPPPAEELEEALRRLGIKPGTQVEVGEEELEWQ